MNVRNLIILSFVASLLTLAAVAASLLLDHLTWARNLSILTFFLFLAIFALTLKDKNEV